MVRLDFKDLFPNNFVIWPGQLKCHFLKTKNLNIYCVDASQTPVALSCYVAVYNNIPVSLIISYVFK